MRALGKLPINDVAFVMPKMVALLAHRCTGPRSSAVQVALASNAKSDLCKCIPQLTTREHGECEHSEHLVEHARDRRPSGGRLGEDSPSVAASSARPSVVRPSSNSSGTEQLASKSVNYYYSALASAIGRQSLASAGDGCQDSGHMWASFVPQWKSWIYLAIASKLSS